MSDDPRLDGLIRPGIDGDVVLLGFPYDGASKRAGQKTGQDHGPCCLRRFYPKVGPLTNAEYQVSIKKLKVTDMGNIEADGLSVEQGVTVLQKRLNELLGNQQTPIVFGGSK